MSAEVDGALSAPERQAVSAHLSTCTECRRRRADERALKALIHERIPIIPAPPALRQKIGAALDLEDASVPVRRQRFSRRPLWLGSFGALAVAAIVLVLILVGGLGRQPSGGALEAVAQDYLSAERGFASSSALSSPDDLAQALMTEFGYPFIWDFSSVGLTLAGARIEHRPGGRTVAYSLYKGKRGSILCINLRRWDFSLPPGGKDLHGVRFYKYRGLWVGVVNYGSVFCYFVSRMAPAEMLPALIHGEPKLGTS